jgi:hypothetical protein
MNRNSPVEAEIHRFGGGKTIITKTTAMNSKTAPEHPQHQNDTQTIIFPDLHKHHLIQNSQKMGRTSPVEAAIHCFREAKSA